MTCDIVINERLSVLLKSLEEAFSVQLNVKCIKGSPIGPTTYYLFYKNDATSAAWQLEGFVNHYEPSILGLHLTGSPEQSSSSVKLLTVVPGLLCSGLVKLNKLFN